MAMETARELVDERKEKLRLLKKYDSRRYNLEEAVNYLSGMLLMISVNLGEPESGIRYFFKTVIEKNKEIVLYKALDYTDYDGDNRVWMWVYEYGVKKGIKPGERLLKAYEEVKAEMEKEGNE